MMAAWMVYATLIGACAAIVALALEPVARSRGVATRWLWSAALAASLLVPLAMAMRPVVRAAVGETAARSGGSFQGGPAPSVAPEIPLDAILGAAWIVASLVMLALVLGGVVQLRRSRRRGERREIAGETVALTSDVGPGAVWFGEPRIVLPRWVCSLGEREAELLVRHEREHVRAGDPSLLALSLGALVAAPWNAPLWFIARRLRAAIEIDCDARVLTGGGEAHRYGELLLTVAARRSSRPLAAILAFAEATSPLERRIRAMIERPQRLTVARRLASYALALTAFALACETRRPEPLAPVTTFAVENGRTTVAPELSAAQHDSARGALQLELQAKVPDTVLAGSPTDPVVMVYDARGTLLYSARLSAEGGGEQSFPVSAEAIERVDVIKKGPMLPDKAKGGVIRVTLKPGAERANGTWTQQGGSVRLQADSGASGRREMRKEGAGGVRGDSMRVRENDAEAVDAPLLVVLDVGGRELLRRRGTEAMRSIDATLVERVEVEKRADKLPPEAQGGVIRVFLKAGAKLPG